MVGYENGMVYKIRSEKANLDYYGSTKHSKEYRLEKHYAQKRHYELTGLGYCSAFEVLDHDDAQIHIVEYYPCNSKKELVARESYYQLNFDCVNIRKEGRTRQRYYLDNIDRFSQLHKIYYNNNKDKIMNRVKQYYNDNRDELKEYKKLVFTCDCGLDYTLVNKARHCKSQRHLELVNN